MEFKDYTEDSVSQYLVFLFTEPYISVDMIVEKELSGEATKLKKNHQSY
jgi:hypothetical protein